MRPPELDVTFRLYELDCKSTEDSSADEPYLWILGFKVDAETLGPPTTTLLPTLRVQVFRGAPASPWVVGAGEVHGGDAVPIQPALGTRSFRLKPALLPAAGWFPGLAGVICLLWDQDGMSPSASEAGHEVFAKQFGPALATELNRMLNGEYDDALSRDGDGNVVPGEPDSPDLNWRLARLRDAGGRTSVTKAITHTIREGLQSKIEDAVQEANGVIDDVITFLDRDDLLGAEAQVYLGDELGGHRDFALHFTDGADYTVRGQAFGTRVHAAQLLSSVTHVERRLDRIILTWLRVCWFAEREYRAFAYRLKTTTRYELKTLLGPPPVAVRWLIDDTVLANSSGTIPITFEPMAKYTSPPLTGLAADFPGGPGTLTYTISGSVLEVHNEGGDGVYFGRVRALCAYEGDPTLFVPPATPLNELLELGYLHETQTSVIGVSLTMERKYYEDMDACGRIIDSVNHKRIPVNFGKAHIDPGDPPRYREQILDQVAADAQVLIDTRVEILGIERIERIERIGR
jgi:hypothetical protein